jgi:hypothetical protein
VQEERRFTVPQVVTAKQTLVSLTKTYVRQRAMALIIKDLISNPEVEFHVLSLATFNSASNDLLTSRDERIGQFIFSDVNP